MVGAVIGTTKITSYIVVRSAARLYSVGAPPIVCSEAIVQDVLNSLLDPELHSKLLAALVGLMALVHFAEFIAKLTPTKRDDEAVAGVRAVLEKVIAFLPRFGRGATKLLPLALVFAFGCGVGLPAQGALEKARGIALQVAGLSSDPDVVRRAAAVDYSVAAVREALQHQDETMYRAAAPCAVQALDALLPDIAALGRSADLGEALNLIRALLAASGGQCLPNAAELEDAGAFNWVRGWRAVALRRA